MTIRSFCALGLATVITTHAFGQATTNQDAAAPRPPQPQGPVQRAPANLDGWWNHAVFYQIFVRSFADSTRGPLSADGIGDFDGLIDRLDYLNDGDPATSTDLGVNAIWLMPIMPSESYHGYDIKDYKAIHEQLGTMESFKRFMAECKKRGIRVILDLVPNHCSWDHPWFQDAAAGGPKKDWFIWSSAKPDWKGPWGQDVWHPWPKDGSGTPREHYYGIFWKGMPDLNFRNPDVTAAMHDVVRWWLLPENGGIDGYRIDAIRHLIEEGQQQESTPSTHAWLKEFNRFYKSLKPDAFTVGEVWAPTEQVVPYIGGELDSCFEFHTAYATIDAINEGKRERLDRQWEVNLSQYPQGQYSTFLANHDMDRVMSRFGGGNKDSARTPAEAWAKARLAATLQLTSPGIPFVYYGEEIGMVGVKPDEDLRTPMQWTPGRHGGFTTAAKPWRPANKDIATKNVEQQSKDPQSLLNLYRKLVRLRLGHEALRTGSMTLVDSGHPAVYAFVRTNEKERFLVVANLSAKPVSAYGIRTPEGFLRAGDTVVEALTDRLAAKPVAGGAYKPAGELGPHAVMVLRFEPIPR